MRTIKLICLLVYSGIIPMASDCMGEDLVTPAQIASVFGYPAKKLVVTGLTKEAQSDKGPGIIAACQVKAPDNTFGRLTLFVTKTGLSFTPEFEKQMMKEREPGVKPGIRKIPLGKNAYGYAGFVGFGPGGSEEFIFARIPEKGLDIVVKFFIRGEEPLMVSVPETEAYYHLIMEGGEPVTKRLIKCAELIVAATEKLPASPSGSGQKVKWKRQRPTNANSNFFFPTFYLI